MRSSISRLHSTRRCLVEINLLAKERVGKKTLVKIIMIVEFSNVLFEKKTHKNTVGWSKNPVFSRTDKLMAGTKFSDYLGVKHYKKAKNKTFQPFEESEKSLL